MVYIRNASREHYLLIGVSTNCTNDLGTPHETTIPPFKTINYKYGEGCGVGHMEIKTVETRYADKNSLEYLKPNRDDTTFTDVWWKGMVPFEPMGTIHIIPEKREVYSDLPGSVKILIPNELEDVAVEENFASLLDKSERDADLEGKNEKVEHYKPVKENDQPDVSSKQTQPSRFKLPSFSTIIKILLVILGVVGAFWYIMKNKKKMSLY